MLYNTVKDAFIFKLLQKCDHKLFTFNKKIKVSSLNHEQNLNF